MNVLVVWAHPLADSFSGALCRTATAALEAAGHRVDCADLYREGFRAAISAAERRAYHDPGRNRDGVAGEVARLQGADGLVLIFPTWNFGVPAILKGYLDRVMLPGVAYTLEDGVARPGLSRVRRFACITTYGARRWVVKWVVGDPLRTVMTRGLRRLCPDRTRAQWLALYDLNRPDRARCAAYLRRVERTLSAW